MWMEEWLAEILFQERIAEARRAAAVNRLLRQQRSSRPPRQGARSRRILRQVAQAMGYPRLKRLVERRATS
jgi:hypothetical protein